MLYIKLELRPLSLFKTKIYISCQKVYPKWENPSTFSPDFAPCCKRVWGCTALIWEPASCHRWGSTLVFLRTSYKESYTPRTRIHQKWSQYKDSMCCSTNLATTKMGEVLQQQHHHRQQHHQHSTTNRRKNNNWMIRFLKEKGEVEREYAKGLRRLVTRWELLAEISADDLIRLRWNWRKYQLSINEGEVRSTCYNYMVTWAAI